jgi:starch synthase
MNILYLASEVAPFSKTGGLADVAEALPATLASLGHQVTVVTPLYREVRDDRIRPLDLQIRLRFPFGTQPGRLHSAQVAPGHRVVFLEHPGFFDREGLYQKGGVDYPDNHRRFAFLSIGALAAAQRIGLVPQIVHLNDWQTGLAAVALATGYRATSLSTTKSLFTIHNLAYQGLFPRSAVADLGLPWSLFNPDQLEFYDQINFLKAGLVFADALSTVSPTYAREIQTPQLGCGLDGLLRKRSADLHGILNGINVKEWSPGEDPLIPARFTADDLSGKTVCKKELLVFFGLTGQSAPLFGMVSRMVVQKGLDILLAVLPKVLEEDLRLVLLGSGDAAYERALQSLAARYPTKLAVKIGFDRKLSHWIEAGSDFFLMPSRYEPCGLNQMYSLRYGTIPIVRATGGLEDSVEDLSSPEGTGVKFSEYSAPALGTAIARALDLYADPQELKAVRQRGMTKDFSWTASARRYEALYRSLVEL